MPLKRDWFSDQGPWWGPYLGVLIFATFALLAVVIFALLDAAEIMRVLRLASG